MISVKVINDLYDLNQVANEKSPDSFYNVIFNLVKNEKYDSKKLQLLEYFTTNFDSFKNHIKFVNVVVPYEKIPKNQFEYLLNLYNKTQNDIPCYVNVNHRHIDDDKFYDETYNLSWEIKTIIKANIEIEKVCKFIKERDFSPFEALAYIHNYVSNVANYNISNAIAKNWYCKDQFFAGAYNDIPEVVCAGYSSLMKEIIDNLNMPELNCQIINVNFEHLKKGYYASHARCLIKIKDKKYGLNQTIFDDPTWDNDEKASCSKYTHFAMPNNCHDINVSKMYDYIGIYHIDEIGNKSIRVTKDFNIYKSLQNKSKNKIDQKMIETAYANVMHKTYLNESANEIYTDLKQLAKESFNEQLKREYIGNLTQSKPIITKKEIEEICKEVNNKVKYQNEAMELSF